METQLFISPFLLPVLFSITLHFILLVVCYCCVFNVKSPPPPCLLNWALLLKPVLSPVFVPGSLLAAGWQSLFPPLAGTDRFWRTRRASRTLCSFDNAVLLDVLMLWASRPREPCQSSVSPFKTLKKFTEIQSQSMENRLYLYGPRCFVW